VRFLGHTHLAVPLYTTDQPVVEAATYITHNRHSRRTSVSSAGFEPAIPGIKWVQTYALDHTATSIGSIGVSMTYFR